MTLPFTTASEPMSPRALALVLGTDRPAVLDTDLLEAQARFDLHADGLFHTTRNIGSVRAAVRAIGPALGRRSRVMRFSLMIAAADGAVSAGELVAVRHIGKWLSLGSAWIETELDQMTARGLGHREAVIAP